MPRESELKKKWLASAAYQAVIDVERAVWLKLHLRCGVKTNIVTSVQVSDGYARDYPYFKGLVDRTADAGFTMKEVRRSNIETTFHLIKSKFGQRANNVESETV